MSAWIRNRPELKVEKSEPVAIGGVSGTQIGVSVIAPNGGDAVLFRVAHREFFLASEKESRVIVLEDVSGDTVIIAIEGTKAQLEALNPKAQDVLGSVEWKFGPNPHAIPCSSATPSAEDVVVHREARTLEEKDQRSCQ